MLDRLKRDGMVAIVRSEPQPRRPDRHIYAITDAGREELERWPASPSPPAAGYRDELFLKLSAAARAGGPTFHGVVRREREALLAELHALRALPGEDALGELLVEGAALGVEARLRLLDAAEEDAAALVAAAAPAAGSAPARERRQAS